MRRCAWTAQTLILLADAIASHLMNLPPTAGEIPGSCRMPDMASFYKGGSRYDRSDDRLASLLSMVLKALQSCIRDTVSRDLIRNEMLY